VRESWEGERNLWKKKRSCVQEMWKRMSGEGTLRGVECKLVQILWENHEEACVKKAIGSFLCSSSIEMRFRCSFTLMIIESNGFNRVHMDESV
jgi:hypothetical protein